MKRIGVLLTVILLAAVLCGCTLAPGAVRYEAAKQYEYDCDEDTNTIYGIVFRRPVTINVGEGDVVDLIDCVFKKDIIINAGAGSTTAFLGMCKFAEGTEVIFNQASEEPRMPKIIMHHNINVMPSGRAIVIAHSDEKITVNGREYTFEDCRYAVKAVNEGSLEEIDQSKEYPAFGIYCHPDPAPSISVTAYEKMWEPLRRYP